MSSLLWYIITLGIPLFGVAICTVGCTLCYRWARSRRIGLVSAMLGYLVATALPIGLAVMAIKCGSYLASHDIEVFCCEKTMLLVVLMLYYFWLAIASNMVLSLTLGLISLRRT